MTEITAHPIRLVATDLDGTLLRRDGTISTRTRDALRRVQAARIAVVLVTGRPPRFLRALASDLDLSGVAICCNGALTYDLATETIVRHIALPAEHAHTLIHALRAAVPDVCFAMECGLEYGHDPDYAALVQRADTGTPRRDDALALCDAGVTKLIVRHPEMPLDDLLALTRRLAGETATATHSGAPFIEVSAVGITKAHALAALCAERSIPATSVIAFGDMTNDLPMLAFAGRSVAVANAHPAVRAAASELTASNEDDGVAQTLERLLSP